MWTTIVAAAVAVVAALLALRNVINFSPSLPVKHTTNGHLDTALRLDETTTAKNWSLLHHLGGYGPYVQKVHGVTYDSATPDHCRVEQVHMMARHTERFPTVTAGNHMLDLYQRIASANGTLNGSLEFANRWNFFSEQPHTDFEQLTRNGPHAGNLTASKLGMQLRSTYRNLLSTATTGRRLRLWASDSQRVIDTTKYFLDAFIGPDWPQSADLQIVPETADQGADTLTPGDTCLRYANDADDFGWNYGSWIVDIFKSTYLDAIHHRLLEDNPNLPLSENELYVMQEMCAFELMAIGESEWCNVFTHDDWEGFEYARDLLHYYRSGPGNPYSATMGWLWLNATASLLLAGPEAGTLFLSFVHDGDIIPMLTALDLFPQYSGMPVLNIRKDRTWRISDTVPMGARIIFERMTCGVSQECWSNEMYPNHLYCSPPEEDEFVRIVVNDRAVPLHECDSGPGGSCHLSQFLQRITQNGETLDNFQEKCGLSDDSPKAITFLHQ
ncbi:hypothetical protein AMS68_006581 [Peltaster fructicola]|uniref:3-phytase n=1 Tax=Peltaster fructicola TaxID=286661 RepID=A0A6H0Y229_9PEZI|nr:hypothetical protein AMS68_006581 [Peltaster fructicola]